MHNTWELVLKHGCTLYMLKCGIACDAFYSLMVLSPLISLPVQNGSGNFLILIFQMNFGVIYSSPKVKYYINVFLGLH